MLHAVHSASTSTCSACQVSACQCVQASQPAAAPSGRPQRANAGQRLPDDVYDNGETESSSDDEDIVQRPRQRQTAVRRTERVRNAVDYSVRLPSSGVATCKAASSVCAAICLDWRPTLHLLICSLQDMYWQSIYVGKNRSMHWRHAGRPRAQARGSGHRFRGC